MTAGIGLDLERAAQYLREDDVVGMPTETVYGLAGNGLSESALLRIFKVKNRPYFDPLILHVASTDGIGELAGEFPDVMKHLVKTFWPGPLTLLLPRSTRVPDLVTAGLPEVALRMPAHPLAAKLLSLTGFPLAAPSANPFGYVSPTTAAHVFEQLGNLIPYILDGGPCEVGVESTIVGLNTDGRIRIFRQGAITREALVAALDVDALENAPLTGGLSFSSGGSPKVSAPGNLVSHYAPLTPFFVLGDPADLENDMKRLGHSPAACAWLFFSDADRRKHSGFTGNLGEKSVRVLSPEGKIEEAARNLYKMIRELDALGLSVIFSTQVPDTGLGRAINDRLRRAAGKGFS